MHPNSTCIPFLSQSAHNEALEYLQKMCSNDVNVKVGQISPTGMQNERGGYENDCMLLRQAHNRSVILPYLTIDSFMGINFTF